MYISDIKPPEFEKCPSIKTAYADRSLTTGRVWWDDPIVRDNSGTVYLVQTTGPKSGDELEVGEHAVTYIARDGVNNTAECSFKIIVKRKNVGSKKNKSRFYLHEQFNAYSRNKRVGTLLLNITYNFIFDLVIRVYCFHSLVF